MASYRTSQFLPAAAAIAGSLVRPTVGRGIDELERESILAGPTESGAMTSSSIAPLMAEERDTDLARSSAQTQREREGGEALALVFPFTLDRGPVDLTEVEDRRLFHPVVDPDLRTVRGSKTRLEASSLPQMASTVRIVSSHHVITCIRRKVRREVLFARGKGGANRYRPPQSEEVCQ